MRSEDTAVEQQTLSGKTTDLPRAVPETMIHCEECGDLVLPSRRQDHEHDLSAAESGISPKTAESVEKVPEDAILDTQTYEVAFHYEVVETIRVEAGSKGEAKEAASHEQTYRGEFIKIQAGNPAVNGGEERDTVRNNHRSVADRLPHTKKRNLYECGSLHMKYGGSASHGRRQTRHGRQRRDSPPRNRRGVSVGVQLCRPRRMEGRLQAHLENKTPRPDVLRRARTDTASSKPRSIRTQPGRRSHQGRRRPLAERQEGVTTPLHDAIRSIRQAECDVPRRPRIPLHGERACRSRVRPATGGRQPAHEVPPRRRVRGYGCDASVPRRDGHLFPPHRNEGRRGVRDTGRRRRREQHSPRRGPRYRTDCRHVNRTVLERRLPQPPSSGVRAGAWRPSTDGNGVGPSDNRTDGRPRDAVGRRLPTPTLESHRPRSRRARVRQNSVRGVDGHPRTYAGREEVPCVGVPPLIRLHGVQGRSGRDRCHAGRSGVHVQALLEVRDDAGREPPVASEVLLPEVRLQDERGLQRGEEYRVSATPCGAKVSARRGDTSPRPEVGDAEREWRLLACQPIGLARTGVHRQAPPFRAGKVTSVSEPPDHNHSHHTMPRETYNAAAMLRRLQDQVNRLDSGRDEDETPNILADVGDTEQSSDSVSVTEADSASWEWSVSAWGLESW